MTLPLVCESVHVDQMPRAVSARSEATTSMRSLVLCTLDPQHLEGAHLPTSPKSSPVGTRTMLYLKSHTTYVR